MVALAVDSGSSLGLRHAFCLVSFLGAGGLLAIGAAGLASVDAFEPAAISVLGRCAVTGGGRCVCADWEARTAGAERFCFAYEAVFPSAFAATGSAPPQHRAATCDAYLGKASLPHCLATAVSAGGVDVANISAPTASERAAQFVCRLNVETRNCFVGEEEEDTSRWKFTALIIVGGIWMLLTLAGLAAVLLLSRRKKLTEEELQLPTVHLLQQAEGGHAQVAALLPHQLVAVAVDGGWQFARVARRGRRGGWDVVSLCGRVMEGVQAEDVRSQSFRQWGWARAARDVAAAGVTVPKGSLGVVTATATPADLRQGCAVTVTIAGCTVRAAAGDMVPAAPVYAGDPVLAASAPTDPTAEGDLAWQSVVAERLERSGGDDGADWLLRAADGGGQSRTWPFVRRHLEPDAAADFDSANYVFVDPQGVTAPCVMTAAEVAHCGGVRHVCGQISDATRAPLPELGVAAGLLMSAHVAAGRPAARRTAAPPEVSREPSMAPDQAAGAALDTTTRMLSAAFGGRHG